MNETIKVLKERRGYKAYKSEQVKAEELQTVLECGSFAPTARGLQSPVIIAVQNEQDRAEVARLNAAVVNMPNDPYYGAPTIVIVFAPDNVFGPLDGSAVVTNMTNAAHAIGLASRWIHRSREVFETEEGKALMRKWGVDENLKGVASLALGYGDGEMPEAAPRKADYFKIV